MNKKIGLIAISIIAVIAVVGAVSAQEQTPEPGTTTQVPILRNLLQIVADDLGVQTTDILQQMRGQTLSEIIQTNNGDIAKITADITAAVTDRVNQAVASGAMTQERADQLLGGLETAVQNALQGSGMGFGMGRFGGHLGQGGRGMGGNGLRGQMERPFLRDGVRPLLNAATNATGLTEQEIAQELRAGKSLSEVITEHGGSPDTVLANAVATAKSQLDQAVTNGRLTQTQEDAILNGLQAAFQAMMNNSFTPRQTVTNGSV